MGNVFVDASNITFEGARFIDVRFQLQDDQWGIQEFGKSHIKGAIYWHLEEDLSDMTSDEGRHPMPSKKQLQSLFEQSGLTEDDTIYVYDQGAAPFAARAWWMLKYGNFKHVYIVNGGFDALKEAGLPVTNEPSNIAKTKLSIEWNEAIYASRQDVKQIADGKDQATLLDARAVGRYKGEFEPLDKKCGHIPTAKNFDWEQLITGKQLHANDELLQKVKKDDEIVVYCGSGVTASPLYAILAEEGYEKIRLYVGSFSDWITQYEVEVGENK